MDMQKILERVKLITGDDRELLLTALCVDAGESGGGDLCRDPGGLYAG